MAAMKSAHLLAVALVAAAFNAYAMPGMQGQATDAPVTGTVLESIEVEAYTYLRLKTPSGELWAAIPKAEVKKGAAVTLVPQAVMEDFESKALKRKFDRILFASLADPNAPASGNPHGKNVVAAAKIAKVPKATGADARTVEEVIAGAKKLKDQTVTIRAQVVKVTNGVMGKNWVHLQDGTGSAAKGTHDILVTTTDAIAVGDIVDVRGTVRIDVTVGPGYAYDVMVDGAKVRKS
jgi:hypothetical protein